MSAANFYGGGDLRHISANPASFFGRMSRDPADVVNSYKLLFASERTECIIFGRLPSATFWLVFVASLKKWGERASHSYIENVRDIGNVSR